MRGNVVSFFRIKLPSVRGYFIHELLFNVGAVKCSISAEILCLKTSKENIVVVRKIGKTNGDPVKPNTLIREKFFAKNQSPISSGFKISLNSLKIMLTSRSKTLNILSTIKSMNWAQGQA